MGKEKIIFNNMIPEKNIKWETGDNKRIYLLKEKSKNKIMKKLIEIFKKNQFFKIHFDEIGTFVWNNINGNNSIKDLGELLRESIHGENVPQAEARVEKFILMLLKNKFITISEKE